MAHTTPALIRHALTTAADEMRALADRSELVAVRMMDARNDHLQGTDTSNTGAGPKGDIGDPAGNAALTRNRDDARTDRRALDSMARDMLEITRRMAAIFDTYDPTPATLARIRGNQMGHVIWCENHLKYGHQETREQGATVCRWCRSIKSKHGVYPNRATIEHAYRNGNTRAEDIRRLAAIADPVTPATPNPTRAQKAARLSELRHRRQARASIPENNRERLAIIVDERP